MATPEFSQPRPPEELLSKDPRVKLKNILPDLAPTDARFIEVLLKYEDKEPIVSKAGYTRLFKNMVDLIGDSKKFKESYEARRSAQRVDMMEMIESFNLKEQKAIARNLSGIQMTDGCTVGCPFCGAEAKRGVEKAFTFESYKKFMEKFGKNLPWRFVLYHSSDPFDWVGEDGEEDYTHLADTYFENAKENRSFYTSTAVPEGSEIAIVKFLFDSYLREYDRAKKKLPSESMFRFSQTKENKERIQKILKTMKSFGFYEKFFNSLILIVDREAGDDGQVDKGAKRGHILNVGYYVNRVQRDENDERDIVGINCKDSLRIAPTSSKKLRGETVEISGIISESMEAVTLANPLGVRQVKIEPGRFEIPNRFDHEDYTYPLGRRANSFFRMIPKQTYLVYEKGKFRGKKVVESVRRDLLAFDFALINLEILSDMFLSRDGRKVLVKDKKRTAEIVNSIKDFSKEFEERKQSCLALFDSEADEQAKRVVLKKIGDIEDWLSSVDKRMGLKVSDFTS